MSKKTSTLRMLTHTIKMMEDHDIVNIACDDSLIRLLKEARDLIVNQPEIIQCKDCTHFSDPEGTGFGVCMKIMHGCQDWGFCADGVRK